MPGQPLVSAICVPPNAVSAFWPHVHHHIEAAYAQADEFVPVDVEADLAAGRRLLWIATDGKDVFAAAMTAIFMAPSGLKCELQACGGTDVGRWHRAIAAIEDYARREGCVGLVIRARRGWQRLLEGYTTTAVILSKRL